MFPWFFGALFAIVNCRCLESQSHFLLGHSQSIASYFGISGRNGLLVWATWLSRWFIMVLERADQGSELGALKGLLSRSGAGHK